MDIFTIIIWGATLIFLAISLAKDKKKTKKALRMDLRLGRNMLVSMLSIVFAIGLILTLIPPADIASFLSTRSVFLATVGGGLLGTVTLIPAFIAFPLIGTLVDAGVSMIPSVAFLTTLTMVGIVTLPLEKEHFGVKFTAVRNILSFIFALLIALIMGVVL